jgi:fibronectin type 3 domain-containing protein
VTGLKVSTISSSQLNLNWTASTATDLARYRVYRSGTPTGTYTLVGSPTTNSFANTGLTAGTTYYYAVSAVDMSGNEGARSAVASGTTGSVTASSMHVSAISMTLQQYGNYTRAIATITVVDATGRPVPSAVMYGRFSGATSNSSSSLTNSLGQAYAVSSWVYRPRSGTTFTFTVQNINRTGWTYDSSSNTVNSGTISVR